MSKTGKEVIGMAWTVNGIKLNNTHLAVYNCVKRLSKKQGYCSAWNEQIGKDWMVNRSPDRVSHILTDLRRAGLVAVLCIYEKGRNFVKHRKLTIVGDFLKAVTPSLSSIATNNEVHSVGCNNKTNNNDGEPLKNLMRSAMKLGISPYRVSVAIRKWGIKYVQEKMAIVANSRTVKNPVAYFLRALLSDWKPNKRASKHIGQPCDYTRKTVFTVNYENHEADAVVKTRSLDEIAKDSPFAKFLR